MSGTTTQLNVSVEDIATTLRNSITELDQAAAAVSNLRKPRSDNNYGRVAQVMEDALNEIERLRADICPHCGINKVRAERATDF
jgi:hypothetical protein